MTENTNLRPAHSKLGASGAERWMNCPGSVALLAELTLDESDAPDYRTNGTAAHAAAADCLSKNLDAWEIVGQKFGDPGHEVEVDVEMADAVQVYLDVARPIMARDGAHVMIEYPISSPVHEHFYGTADLAIIYKGTDFHGQECLDLSDYKHGEGIQVDVEENPQIMYYAYGIILEHSEIDKVTLRIVQPRGFHHDGPVREWETTAAHIREWAETKLIPAMLRTEVDSTLDAGPWCRFCPAKLVCPLLNGLFKAACTANPKEVVNVSDAALGRSYQYTQAVKFYLKALEDEAFRRLNKGLLIEGIKLVPKKANRVFKSEALAVFKERFGEDAFTKPEMKSPAELEKLGAAAKALVKEYAYTPQTGLTVALADDNRPAVKVQSSAEVFGAVAAKLEGDKAMDNPHHGHSDDEDLFSAAPADDLEIPAFLKRK